ncbi:ABC transporter substrate-binding protein [Rhizobium sp. CG5]|uniref:ABC transporter substrate-binding protein n=1 Tax=Rhizobium sp. CG5 TaxID=2726076 RepID=UPI0020332163|nr:ABC transporter substrate-binding protein [Rhizobium sp. CG5]MCM2476145.1 ABC transporter substrate-binding protein [Rhizobium sp. CG5]
MKKFYKMLVLGTAVFATPAFAEDTLYVAGYSGDFQTMFEKEISPRFAAAHNVKIVYVAGNSSETIAKLQAQKANQEINVALVDDGPMHQAVQFGLCDDVADAPVYNDIYDIAKVSTFQGKAVGLGLVATGITYNKRSFEKNGWAVPNSWNDLTDPKFLQRTASNPISGTYGLNTLVMFARLNGGSEKNIEPGFDAVRQKLAPNILSWSSSNAQLAQMFQNGDIDIAVWGSSRAVALNKTGFPVEFVYPKEGAPAIVASACAVAGNKLPEKAQAMLQYLASPEVQAKLATQGFGPTNRNAKVDGSLAAEVPYGDEMLSKLVNVDWETINKNRADWTKQWTRTVEK